MEYADAKIALSGMVRFLRALKPLEEMLDKGNEIAAVLASSRENLASNESKLKMLHANIEITQKKLDSLNDTLSTQWEAKNAEHQQKHDRLIEDWQSLVDAKVKERDTLDAEIEQQAATFKKALAEQDKLIKARETKAAAADKRLADAEAKYAEFKEKLAGL